MRYIEFGQAKTKVSEVMVGLMRIDQMSVAKVTELVETALDEGINALDIADVYGRGACESLLGEVFAANPACATACSCSPRWASARRTMALPGTTSPRSTSSRPSTQASLAWASTTSTRCCCKRAISMGRCRQLNVPSFAHVRTA